MILQFGSRIIVDSNEPGDEPVLHLHGNDCMADYEGTPDLITKMKKGKRSTCRQSTCSNSQIAFPVPLAEFGKTNEGPPIDPKKLKSSRRSSTQELQKKADDLRKKMEQQGQAPADSLISFKLLSDFIEARRWRASLF